MNFPQLKVEYNCLQYLFLEGYVVNSVVAKENTNEEAGLVYFDLIHASVDDENNVYLTPFKCVARAKQAEYFINNIKDGDCVVVEGKIRLAKSGYKIIVSVINKKVKVAIDVDDNILKIALAKIHGKEVLNKNDQTN